jgi:hypothetical protein
MYLLRCDILLHFLLLAPFPAAPAIPREGIDQGKDMGCLGRSGVFEHVGVGGRGDGQGRRKVSSLQITDALLPPEARQTLESTGSR